jgi:tetratricopeptide (TPR) repeat protein
MMCFPARARETNQTAVFWQRAEQAYQTARARYRREPANVEAAWQFGRACSDRGDVARHDKERAAFAEEGILACRQALIDNPKSAFAHYYLGINLGDLAGTRGVGALSELREMEDEWNTANRLDPDIDHAGPDRCLGLLFTQAPGWPLSIGSRTKAIKYLTDAVRLSPGYPDNLLSLAETYLRWNDFTPAQGLAARIPAVMREARKELTGPAWESIWIDWDRRWDAIQARLNESSHFSSPHTVR